MENKLIEHRRAIESALAVVNYKIENLKDFYSSEQVRCWYRERNMLAFKLSTLPTEEQVRELAKINTAFRKSIHSPKRKSK